jgi:chloramphenicol 3-O phosphotransferase
MHRAILASAKVGINIVADHVLVEPDWVKDCAKLFHDFNAYLIGVRCDLAILEKREQARKDRTWGQARLQYEKVHAHGVYDFEVDSGRYAPEENLAQILTFLEKDIPPKALKIINHSHHPS